MRALPDRPTTMTVPVLAAAARRAGRRCLPIAEATAMLAAMAARASNRATPGPARCHCTVLGFMARAGSMQVAWSSEEGARWAQRRVLGKTRAMASGGHERRDNRMHGQHGKASVWPA